MSIGFDLTQFGAAPTPETTQPRPAYIVNNPNPTPQQQQPQVPADPNAPKTIKEALTKPIEANLVDEEGNEWQDNLKKKAPGLKKQLWNVDKCSEGCRPVQVVDDKGRTIWIDQTGNNILDPATGEILTSPPPASNEDRQEINYHGENDDSMEIKW